MSKWKANILGVKQWSFWRWGRNTVCYIVGEGHKWEGAYFRDHATAVKYALAQWASQFRAAAQEGEK